MFRLLQRSQWTCWSMQLTLSVLWHEGRFHWFTNTRYVQHVTPMVSVICLNIGVWYYFKCTDWLGHLDGVARYDKILTRVFSHLERHLRSQRGSQMGLGSLYPLFRYFRLLHCRAQFHSPCLKVRLCSIPRKVRENIRWKQFKKEPDFREGCNRVAQ